MQHFFNLCFLLAFCLWPGTSPLLAQPASDENSDAFFEAANQFFAQYVVDKRLKYAEIKAQPAVLNKLIEQLAQYSLEGKSPAWQQAFWINAYNLCVIQGVVQAYPMRSPQEVPGFFEQPGYKVAGQTLSLNQLEKQQLFEAFGDPRFHFVLVCAAVSCPPLAAFAYQPDKLDQQLDEQTRLALNDDGFVRVNHAAKKIQLSQIFNWYAHHFGGSQQAIRNFINQYRKQPLPESYSLGYYPYDWSLNDYQPAAADQAISNVQYFTPSVLLKKGQIEVKLFNNLYTQTAFRDANRQKMDLGERQTYFTGIYQFTIGVSQNRRWNVGIEAYLNSVRQDADPGSSPLRIFGSNKTGENFSKTALAYLGPRIRFSPFASIPRLSITSSLQLPLSKDLELIDDQGNSRFLAHNRVNWFTQVFFDQYFGDFQLFTEFDLLFRFKTKRTSFNQPAFFRTPLTVFLSYFPNSRSTLNLNAQYSPAWGKSNGQFSYLNDFVQLGAGAKYQLTPDINLEIIYTNFISSRNQGAGQTFNLGIVFIR